MSTGANAHIAKTSEKNKCLCCRDVHANLLLWLKSQNAREESCHPFFYGNCAVISNTCYSYLPST